MAKKLRMTRVVNQQNKTMREA